MRKLLLALPIAALVTLPVAADAQMTAGPTLAWHADADFGVGVTVGGDADFLTEGAGWLGDFIWFFPPGDGVTYFEINAHATFDFATSSTSVFPFLLAGPHLARTSVDGGGSSTKLGMNVGAGIDFNADRFRPSVGARFEIGGGKGFVVFATLPFQGGGS